MKNRYANNPYYTIIAGRLYFITRGGKHIYCRDATLLDYEKIDNRRQK
jgi:hypothetical protein